MRYGLVFLLCLILVGCVPSSKKDCPTAVIEVKQ